MKLNEEQIDLRIRRTHKLLWQSLYELMTDCKQKYSTITINQICDRAMVHRTTFYKHFEDKNDLLKVGIYQLGEEMEKIPINDRLTKPFKVLEQLLNHQVLGGILQVQMHDSQFMACIQTLNVKNQKEEKHELYRLFNDSSIPEEIVIEFYSGIIEKLYIWWLKNSERVTAEEMDHYFHKMINQNVFDLK
ncbi:TetR/AcrR family transcriptional regulator [Lysinibacillus cavernae]|uniref:TetR/AcrR family transcriptional regulator n=1 Tax=Lysinibacillus cavernae TaxID=2666135 RepID=UPI0012D8FD6B|nr:TetR/AcrR family transcriptional regulator [Lysinibacillus cavernae]